MQRILILTDNVKATAPLQHELIRAGYPVSTAAASEADLLAALSPRPPQIILLDGTSVRLAPKELRDLLNQRFPGQEARIVWLAGQEQIARFDPSCGLDDFVVLPCGAAELLARIRLLLWKTHRVDGADLIFAGDLVIDQANYTVHVNGRRLELTFKEYELLRFLAMHRGRVFTREALLNQVWGYDYYGGTRTVDVHIRRIRAKLGPDHEDLVETVRNVGYRFNMNA